MTDGETREEVKEQTKVSGIREVMKEVRYVAYLYQPFNETESKNYRNPRFSEHQNERIRRLYRDICPQFSSYKFPILPVIDGVVKPCSYSELENITNFETILTTPSGRLFRGTITEGSEERPVIVKTWDFLLPEERNYPSLPSQFCDEIELYETVNGHPHLAKVSRYCCERRLAVVYDEEFTTVLSDVLRDDNFGWDKRINVATQFAELLVWLHEKKIAVGGFSSSSIMIDKKEKIKVFDFGCISHGVNEDSGILINEVVGRHAPETLRDGVWTLKCDVCVFGLLLVDLFDDVDDSVSDTILNKTTLVHKCFEEVDDQTVSNISNLTLSCLGYPSERPTMKMVLDNLLKLRMQERVRGKRKRDENELRME